MFQQVVVLENPPRAIDSSAEFPISRPCNVRNFGKDSIETLQLSCPKDPSVYLQQAYGHNWQTAPFNKFNGKTWVLDESDVSLEQFLRKKYHYTGPLEPTYKPPL